MNEIVWAIRGLANAISLAMSRIDSFDTWSVEVEERLDGIFDEVTVNSNAHGSLEDRIEALESSEGEIDCARADIDHLEERLDGLDSDISGAVELECRIDEISDELNLQEHRIGSLEAKGSGVVNEDLIHSLEKITQAVQHLYEKHGMAMDFDSEKAEEPKAEEPKTEGGE